MVRNISNDYKTNEKITIYQHSYTLVPLLQSIQTILILLALKEDNKCCDLKNAVI